jgi:hypothetical protein
VSRVRLLRDGAIGRIVLARPEKRNVLDREAADELFAALAQLEGDASIRVIHLTADGVDFCIGADPDALEKAQRADQVLRERLDRLGLRFDQVLTEYVGVSATHGPLAGSRTDAPEVQWRIGVRSADRGAVERFTREIAPLVLNGPPSVTGFAGGRPKVEEIVAYWPALVDKSVVRTSVEILA